MVSIYDYEAGKELARTELTSWRPRDRGADRLLALEFAGAGKYLLAATGEVTRLWEVSMK